MNHTADHGIRFGRIAAIAPRKGHREGPRLLHEGIWLYEDIREQQSRRLQQRTGIVDHHMATLKGAALWFGCSVRCSSASSRSRIKYEP